MGGLLTANMLTRDKARQLDQPHAIFPACIPSRAAGDLALAPPVQGLFAAVVSECPLADMERFRFLGMGHSWIPELGDPSTPEGWATVQQYSPLHRITPQHERRFPYPRALFVSSSNDDRTSPAHGRKMVAKLNQLVGESAGTLLLEEAEGGPRRQRGHRADGAAPRVHLLLSLAGPCAGGGRAAAAAVGGRGDEW